MHINPFCCHKTHGSWEFTVWLRPYLCAPLSSVMSSFYLCSILRGSVCWVAIFLLLFQPFLRAAQGERLWSLLSDSTIYPDTVLSLTVPYPFFSPRAQSKWHRGRPVTKLPFHFLPTLFFLFWKSLYNFIGGKACSNLYWFYLYPILSALILWNCKCTEVCMRRST